MNVTVIYILTFNSNSCFLNEFWSITR